jgi:hypothetical protein
MLHLLQLRKHGRDRGEGCSSVMIDTSLRRWTTLSFFDSLLLAIGKENLLTAI